jgi:protoporphyrinogen oxidase
LQSSNNANGFNDTIPMSKKTVFIIGAGPAGLTAAYELVKTGNFIPVIIEKLDIPGGLSRTVNYKGNRIDIGGHRFFSKSDKILEWWLKILPLENATGEEIQINYQNKSRKFTNSNSPSSPSDVMLVRDRISRVYFLKQLFPYPIKMNGATLKKLGVGRSFKILISFFIAKVRPLRPENTLKDFMINHFGKELYKTFFEAYTRKVWGVEADKIPSEWGKQRIKGVSVSSIISNALRRKKKDDIRQKETQTSFIEKFLYPKYGPGQLWEKVADDIVKSGGRILYNHEVAALNVSNDIIQNVKIVDRLNRDSRIISADFFISTMPIKDLMNALTPGPSAKIKQVADGLEYRDFITVGVLVKKMKLRNKNGGIISDNWIYIQEKNVKVGRLQIFNNWSPYMVNDPATVWLGLEYFCQEGDSLWQMPENELLQLAESELIKMSIIEDHAIIDGTVIKVEKAYPCYFGAYDEIEILRKHLDVYKNLFLIGRNGMHRYNNQDHSMLTAMEAVSKIVSGDTDKSSIWAINTEDVYHEEA